MESLYIVSVNGVCRQTANLHKKNKSEQINSIVLYLTCSVSVADTSILFLLTAGLVADC